jgi:hypothetical protein
VGVAWGFFFKKKKRAPDSSSQPRRRSPRAADRGDHLYIELKYLSLPLLPSPPHQQLKPNNEHQHFFHSVFENSCDLGFHQRSRQAKPRVQRDGKPIFFFFFSVRNCDYFSFYLSP